MNKKWGKLMVRFLNEAVDEAKRLEQEHEQAESAAASRRSTAEWSPTRRSTAEWLSSRRTTLESLSSRRSTAEVPDFASPRCGNLNSSSGGTEQSDPGTVIAPAAPTYDMLVQLLLEEQHRSAEVKADLAHTRKKLAFTQQQLTAMYNTEDKLRQQLADKDREIGRLYAAQKGTAAAEAYVIAAEAARKRAALENSGSQSLSLVRQKSTEINKLQLVVHEQRQQLQAMTVQLGYVQQQQASTAAVLAMREAELAKLQQMNCGVADALQSGKQDSFQQCSCEMQRTCYASLDACAATQQGHQQQQQQQLEVEQLLGVTTQTQLATSPPEEAVQAEGSSSSSLSGCTLPTPDVSTPRRPRFPTDGGVSSSSSVEQGTESTDKSPKP